jgi:hypothetical protein
MLTVVCALYKYTGRIQALNTVLVTWFIFNAHDPGWNISIQQNGQSRDSNISIS